MNRRENSDRAEFNDNDIPCSQRDEDFEQDQITDLFVREKEEQSARIIRRGLTHRIPAAQSN